MNGFVGAEMAFWRLKFGFDRGSGGFVFRGQVFVFNGLVALFGAGVSCGARLRAWGERDPVENIPELRMSRMVVPV